MTWSPDGPSADTLTRQGWTPDGPDPVAVESRKGWTWVPQAVGEDISRLGDLSTVTPATDGRDLLTLADRGVLALPTLAGVDQIVLRDSALTTPAVNGQDGIQTGDRGTLGVYGAESLLLGDLGVAAPATSGRDILALGDRSTAATATAGSDLAALGDSGTGGFSAHDPASTAYNSAAGTFTYTIPVWARYLVLVGIGGGASGMTGNGAINQSGTGGAAAQWAGRVLERGVDIPWATRTITVVVGAGGAQPANSDWAGPTAGSATTFTATGMTTLTCAAGSGTNGGTSGGGIREGQAAGNYTIDGDTYIGGSDQPSGSGAAGNPPGAGGAGGNGGIFGFRTRGGAGARGGAWAKARQ